MKSAMALFGILLLVSCGATVGVDYDEQIDFSEYTTYNFYPSIKSGLNELDDKRISKIADSLLQMKGLTRSEDPQLFVNFFASEVLTNSRNTIGVGVGGGGRNVGVGVSGGIPIGGKIINQQLTVDLIDVARDDLVWQAVVDGEYKEKASPKQKEAYYNTVLSKILKKYPPGKNKREKK
ncbi:MAG: DUF4136 domain-containing protein [Bacteroidia bacterium]|nr:DUF4136 domain-containing protein [Bacteroidia bacterium]MBT8276282.1 DUF4136 domain-containing protein [Bacteroidia bacterium]NNF30615.1 DUF4136 domain-containing protein [Flavobacteriaceae bacterium]NNK53175.1 DUF4136 domain-containing protein [Flavobacteriaceae bacterium]NNM09389.1 DUF4136 domain-containing protein [Flavobacteriaceae bacterium]